MSPSASGVGWSGLPPGSSCRPVGFKVASALERSSVDECELEETTATSDGEIDDSSPLVSWTTIFGTGILGSSVLLSP